MSLVELGELVTIKGGGTPNKKVEEYWNGKIKWATVKDFKSTCIFDTVDRITIEGVNNSATNIIPSGTIVVPTRMAVGKVAVLADDMAINQDLKAIFHDERVHKRYLFNYLLANGHQLERQATGATVKGIKLEALRSLKIPLPPLAEQKRIAAILDQADAIVKKRQAALDKLNTLGQSIFYDMFGDAKGTEPLTKFASIKFGFAFKSKKYVEDNSQMRLCRGANVLPNYISWKDVRYYPIEEVKDLADYALAEADIVVAMDRPWISTGFKIAKISKKDLPCMLVQRVARIRGSKNKQAFLYHLLQTIRFTRHCKPTETTIPHISPKDFKSFQIRTPANDELEEFDKRLTLISSQTRASEEALESSSNLFASLQQRAFRGEL